MKSSKLVHLLSRIPEKKRPGLRKFAAAAFHNQHQGVQRLLFYVLDHLASPPEVLSKLLTFSAVFPNKPFNDQKLRLVISYARKVVEKYLIWEEVWESDAVPPYYLLRALSRMGDATLFRIMGKRYQQKIKKSPQRDLYFYQQQFQINELQFDNQTVPEQATGDLLQTVDQSLDLYFFAAKLKYACRILAHQGVYTTPLKQTFILPVIAEIERRNLYELPAIGVYFNTYKILIGQEAEHHFQQLLHQIQAYGDQFPQPETRSFYLFAVNYCIQQTNQGKSAYLETAFNLYKQSLENEILFDEGFLSPYTYKNIIGFGLKLEEYTWVGEFIETYQQSLPASSRNDFYNFSKARLAFAQQEFKQVSRILNAIYIRDLFTQIDAKVLLMKANFELGDFQAIEYQLDTFKKLLKRREALAYHREHYKNFYQFLSKILRIGPGDESAKKEIAIAISQTPSLMDREWLLSKVTGGIIN